MKKILLLSWFGLCQYNWGPLPPFRGDALHQDCNAKSVADDEVNISTSSFRSKLPRRMQSIEVYNNLNRRIK